jgi:hypothetical protein
MARHGGRGLCWESGQALTREARQLAEQVVAAAQRQGWRYRSGRHHVLYAPDGENVEVISRTPRTAGAVEQSIRRMRRAGFVWPEGNS